VEIELKVPALYFLDEAIQGICRLPRLELDENLMIGLKSTSIQTTSRNDDDVPIMIGYYFLQLHACIEPSMLLALYLGVGGSAAPRFQ
jgi:hypothetical protein